MFCVLPIHYETCNVTRMLRNLLLNIFHSVWGGGHTKHRKRLLSNMLRSVWPASILLCFHIKRIDPECTDATDRHVGLINMIFSIYRRTCQEMNTSLLPPKGKKGSWMENVMCYLNTVCIDG